MSELIDAAENGDIDFVRQLLDQGAEFPDINIQNRFGSTALMEASSNGNIEIVRLLLANGADPHIRGGWPLRMTALIEAAGRGQTEVVELLLDNGVDLDIQNELGYTALFMASLHGRSDTVQLLLNRGADANILDEHGNTALMEASSRGHTNIVRLLELHMNAPEYLKAATTVQKTFRGKKTRKKKYIDRFKSYKPWKGTEAFNTILYDDEDVYKYLTENDRNFVIKFNQDYEAWNIDDYLKVIEIEGVNDINVFYECYEASGYTPENNINKDTIYIKLGAYNFVVEMPDWLLSIWIGLKGIPVGPNNKIPEPRIFGLVENKMVNALVSSNILEYGGSLVSGDHCNHSDPVMTYKLELLSEETIIADYLNALNLDQYGGGKKQVGGNLIDAVKGPDGLGDGDINHVRLLLDEGADINIQSGAGWTALSYAASNKRVDIVKLLLERGADPNIPNNMGTTALMSGQLSTALSGRRSRYDVYAEIDSLEITKLLLDHGANVNKQARNNGTTALMMASTKDSVKIIELLLSYGADPNILNNRGDTAITLAERYGGSRGGQAVAVSKIIIELLKRHMGSTRIQSRIRGRQTRRKTKTQKAHQQKTAAKLPVDYEASRRIGSYLSKTPYNPEVSRRMKEEEVNDSMAEYLGDIGQYDGGKKQVGGNIINLKGCISNTQPSVYFKESFLNNPLFKLLPEGYDICYELNRNEESIYPRFYLYDSTSPLNKLDYDNVIGSIFIHFNIPLYGWTGWTPWNNMAYVPELITNSDLEGFDLRRAGIGTFLILCSIAYAKSFGINIVRLYDASTGFRTEQNIYEKLGFKYNDKTGHDMVGDINVIYSRLPVFIELKGEKFSNKLNELTEYFNDDEWVEEENDSMD